MESNKEIIYKDNEIVGHIEPGFEPGEWFAIYDDSNGESQHNLIVGKKQAINFLKNKDNETNSN